MMNRKGTLYSVLSILFINYYCVSALSDNNNRHVRGSKRYQYNHPPDFYEPIPVAIVFEEKNYRESKKVETKPASTTETIKSKSDKGNYGPIPVAVVYEEKNARESNKVSTKPVSTTETIKSKINKTNKEQYEPIPVAIVFEEKNDRESKKVSTKPVSTIETTTSKTDKTTKESSGTTMKNDFEDIKITTWRPTSTQIQNSARSTFKRIYPEKEIHIPVEVIYDDEDDIYYNRRRNHLDVTTNNRILKQRGRQQKAYKDISAYRKSTEKVVAATVITTTVMPQVTKKQILEEKKQTGHDTQTVGDLKIQEKSPVVTRFKQITETQPLGVRRTTTTIAPKVVSDKTKGKRREKDPVVPILESENHVYAQNGGFQYSYEGGDGTKSFQMGELKEFGDERTGESVSGGYSYTDKDGRGFSLTYTADENGYRPTGEHLPTSPPVPEAIARALRYLATKPTDIPQDDATKPSTH